MKRTWAIMHTLLLGAMILSAPSPLSGQPDKKDPEKKDFNKKGPPFGFGGPMGQIREIVKQYDKDGDGRLNREERLAAREFLKKDARGGFKGKGKGGFGKGRGEPGKPGPKIEVDDVKPEPKAALYEPMVMRTFFLVFEDKDWEDELAEFYHTDVEVPATLIVDGKKYPNVGVRFRGASSFFTVGKGSKRSFNVSMDFVDKKQRLYGSKTLNLLNSHDDPTFLNSVLFSQVARSYIPTPKANFVKVAINGESWGVYINVQQFNKEFTAEQFDSSKGARWKVQGNPGARGGLEYTGEDLKDYKQRFRIKSKDSEKSWKALVNLCKVLNKTPLDELEKALEPILDIDGTLWFLALDNALVNNDGYWVRSSDYSIYLDPKGKFHMVPHDTNETFSANAGFGKFGGGGGGSSGIKLDPLIGITNTRMPLRSRLLAVPALKERYLQKVRTIAEDKLDWKKLGPEVAKFGKLIEKEVEADTRKLYSLTAFQKAIGDDADSTLRSFADGRRKYLLAHPELEKLKK